MSEELMAKPEVRGVRFLFLVGGFAESPMLQKAVQRALGRTCRIIIPHNVGLTILKGAVLFGLDPTVVSSQESPAADPGVSLRPNKLSLAGQSASMPPELRRWCPEPICGGPPPS